MCRYCKKENRNQPIMFEVGKYDKLETKMEIAKEGKAFVLKYKNKYENLTEMASINYCPICGRKLGDN